MFKYTVALLPGAVMVRAINSDGATAIVQEDRLETSERRRPPTQSPRVRPPVQKTPIYHQGSDKKIAGILYTMGPLLK